MFFFVKFGEVCDSDVIVVEIYCGKIENHKCVFIVRIFRDSHPRLRQSIFYEIFPSL